MKRMRKSGRRGLEGECRRMCKIDNEQKNVQQKEWFAFLTFVENISTQVKKENEFLIERILNRKKLKDGKFDRDSNLPV